MMTVRLPERCKALWRTELRNAETLDCRASGPALRCSRADKRGGVEIDMREHDTAKVYLWTIT